MSNLKIDILDAKLTVLMNTTLQYANQLKGFGNVMHFVGTDNYVLVVDESYTLEDVLSVIRSINDSNEYVIPIKPQKKNKFALFSLLSKEYQFSFSASEEDAEKLKEFGRLQRFSDGSENYLLSVDRRYSFQDVVNYVGVLNDVIWINGVKNDPVAIS